MTHRRASRSDLIRYYRAAADFWLDAIHIQEYRCLQEGRDSIQQRVDVNFYVVAIQRLREVVRMTHKRLHSEQAGQALAEFNERWPRFKELRNSEEHVTGPSLDSPAGIWYFNNFVIDAQAGGVEYLIRIEDARPSIKKLHDSLCELLAVME